MLAAEGEGHMAPIFPQPLVGNPLTLTSSERPVQVGRMSHLPGVMGQGSAFDMLVAMVSDADGRRRTRPAQHCITGLVGRAERFFPVSPDLLVDMSMA
jgi:hypothetical protein